MRHITGYDTTRKDDARANFLLGVKLVTKVILDPHTRAQLHDMKETLQFVDESGRLLGIFTPNTDPTLLEPRISQEEIQQRLNQGGGRPLADILRDLEKRS